MLDLVPLRIRLIQVIERRADFRQQASLEIFAMLGIHGRHTNEIP
jgi:hypothetical protein